MWRTGLSASVRHHDCCSLRLGPPSQPTGRWKPSVLLLAALRQLPSPVGARDGAVGA